MPERLDKLVAARGLAESRERAQMLIEAGLVQVNGMVVDKPGRKVEDDSEIAVIGEVLPYVGRGGLKLEAALKHFRINAKGAVCLDVGASTGGFTDCLLQRGAARVVAIDVGHDQMAASLRKDARVELREGVNARYLSPEQFETKFDIAVADLSFISLTLILPAVRPLIRAGGHIIALVKPQFESGKNVVDTRGIVRDPEVRKAALGKVLRFAEELGLQHRGHMPSPIVGGSGNKEYLACFRTPDAAPETVDPSP